MSRCRSWQNIDVQSGLVTKWLQCVSHKCNVPGSVLDGHFRCVLNHVSIFTYFLSVSLQLTANQGKMPKKYYLKQKTWAEQKCTKRLTFSTLTGRDLRGYALSCNIKISKYNLWSSDGETECVLKTQDSGLYKLSRRQLCYFWLWRCQGKWQKYSVHVTNSFTMNKHL